MKTVAGISGNDILSSCCRSLLSQYHKEFGRSSAGVRQEFDAGLVDDRAEESEPLDNTIHGIIDATRNEEFEERLAGLNR